MTDRFKQPERYKLYMAGANKSQDALVWSEESNDFQALKHKLDERTGGEFLIARIVKGKEYVSCAKGWAENSFRIGVLVDVDKLNQRASAAAILGKIEYKVDKESSPKNEPEFDYEQSKPEKQVKLRGEPIRNDSGVAVKTDGTPKKSGQRGELKRNDKGEILNKDGSVRKPMGRPRHTPEPKVKPVKNGAESATFFFRVFGASINPRGALQVDHKDYQDRDEAVRFAINDAHAFLLVLHHVEKDDMLVRGIYNWAQTSHDLKPDQKIEMSTVHKMAMDAMKTEQIKKSALVERTETAKSENDKRLDESVKQLANNDVFGFMTRVDKFSQADDKKALTVEEFVEEKLNEINPFGPVVEIKEEPDIQDIMDAIDAQAQAYGHKKIADVPFVIAVPAETPDLPETIYKNIIDNQREAARQMNNYIKSNQDLDAVNREIIERNQEIFRLEAQLAALKDSNADARKRSDELKAQADDNAKSIAKLLGGVES